MPNLHTTQGPCYQTLAGQPGNDDRQPPLVSAVVVHYNAPAEILDECLKSLLATRYDALEVILVLNGMSQEECFQVLARWGDHSRVQVIYLKSNLGYGGGANEGVKYAHGKYVAVLNDDIKFDPDWLSPIIDIMEAQTDIGACQPKIRSMHNSDLFDYAGAAGGMLDLFGYPFARGRVFWTVERDVGQYDDEADIFWASGAAMVVRRSVWEKVGGLASIFFLYAEEIDFCWQLQRLGYRIVCVPRSIVYHRGSVSTSSLHAKRAFLISRNHLILVLKNYSYQQLFFLFPVRLLLELINVLYALLKRQPEWAVAILRSLGAVMQSLPSVWRSRKNAAKALGNMTGSPIFYRGSVVFEYFIRKRLTYAELNGTDHATSHSCAQLVSPFDGNYQVK